jgi:hypothetical protein
MKGNLKANVYSVANQVKKFIGWALSAAVNARKQPTIKGI